MPRVAWQDEHVRIVVSDSTKLSIEIRSEDAMKQRVWAPADKSAYSPYADENTLSGRLARALVTAIDSIRPNSGVKQPVSEPAGTNIS